MSDGKRTTVKSTLKIQAQSEHHNTTFVCRSKSEADKAEKSAEIKVEVIAYNSMSLNVQIQYASFYTCSFCQKATFYAFKNT